MLFIELEHNFWTIDLKSIVSLTVFIICNNFSFLKARKAYSHIVKTDLHSLS